jgi:hypothetical protein
MTPAWPRGHCAPIDSKLSQGERMTKAFQNFSLQPQSSSGLLKHFIIIITEIRNIIIKFLLFDHAVVVPPTVTRQNHLLLFSQKYLSKSFFGGCFPFPSCPQNKLDKPPIFNPKKLRRAVLITGLVILEVCLFTLIIQYHAGHSKTKAPASRPHTPPCSEISEYRIANL